MVTLGIQPHLFAALRAGFEAAATDDAPIDLDLLNRVRMALTEASVTALPGLPVLVRLGSADELNALTACFEVGGELHPDVTDDQWDSILALVAQAHRDQFNRQRVSSTPVCHPQPRSPLARWTIARELHP
jgi:hypothetical protein